MNNFIDYLKNEAEHFYSSTSWCDQSKWVITSPKFVFFPLIDANLFSPKFAQGLVNKLWKSNHQYHNHHHTISETHRYHVQKELIIIAWERSLEVIWLKSLIFKMKKWTPENLNYQSKWIQLHGAKSKTDNLITFKRVFIYIAMYLILAKLWKVGTRRYVDAPLKMSIQKVHGNPALSFPVSIRISLVQLIGMLWCS